jgi:hypothetical protein
MTDTCHNIIGNHHSHWYSPLSGNAQSRNRDNQYYQSPPGMETIDQYKMQLQQLQREYEWVKASYYKEISGRRRTEDDLHQQEARFRLMVE